MQFKLTNISYNWLYLKFGFIQQEWSWLENKKKCNQWKIAKTIYNPFQNGAKNGDTTDVASDSYHLYMDDVNILKELNVRWVLYSVPINTYVAFC
jgi:beta-glucosidase/6-phospho-beta-glucosidase/beta-galactosidase